MTWGYVLYGYLLLPALALAYVIVGAWAAFKVGSKLKWWVAKLGAAVITTLLFLAVPSADVIVGKAQFSNLCETEAAVRVFRTVTLDDKYFLSDGSPKTAMMVGRPGLLIAERYQLTSSREEVVTWPRVQKSLTRISDNEQGDVLGELVDFHYWGGWLVQQLPFHASAESCPQLKGRRSIERLVFRSAA